MYVNTEQKMEFIMYVNTEHRMEFIMRIIVLVFGERKS